METEQTEHPSTAWGIASLVTGILGLLSFLMPYFGLPLSILAVVGASRQNSRYKTGVASAGNVLGIIGIVVNSIAILIFGLFLLFAMSI